MEFTFYIFIIFSFPLLKNFNPVVCGKRKSTIWAFLLVLSTIITHTHSHPLVESLRKSTIIMSGSVCSIIWCVWMLKSHRILRDSFSVQGKELCSYYFSRTLTPFFLQISQCTVSHPVMSLFVFFLKKFRTHRNNVSDCFIFGLINLAFGVTFGTIYLRFDVVSSN